MVLLGASARKVVKFMVGADIDEAAHEKTTYMRALVLACNLTATSKRIDVFTHYIFSVEGSAYIIDTWRTQSLLFFTVSARPSQLK